MNKGKKVIGTVTILAAVLALTYISTPSGATPEVVTTEVEEEVVIQAFPLLTSEEEEEDEVVDDEVLLSAGTTCLQDYYDSWYMQYCLIKGELNTLKSPTQIVVKVWHRSIGEFEYSWKSIAACWLTGKDNTILNYSRDTRRLIPVGIGMQSFNSNYFIVRDYFPGWKEIEMRRYVDEKTLGICIVMPDWMPPTTYVSPTYGTDMLYIGNQAWLNAGGSGRITFR